MQKEAIGTTECQTCLEQKCCTELKSCFNIVPDDSGTKVDCDEYATCIANCQTTGGDGEQDCIDACNLTAADGVETAYGTIETCGASNCATECGVQ
jgi:hypothetical protein